MPICRQPSSLTEITSDGITIQVNNFIFMPARGEKSSIQSRSCYQTPFTDANNHH